MTMARRKPATLALSLCLLSVAVGATTTTGPRRGGLEECRPPHCDDTVPEQDVDAGDPVPLEEEVEKNNVDRNDSFCLPNGDGFVGTIEGSSYIVPYAFGLETEENADIVDVLRDIKISVEDYLIKLMIPDACEGSRRLRGNADVLGFRFEKEMDLLSVACTPLVKPDADCGIFEGVIQVFGSGGGILPKVRAHLNDPKTIEVNARILRIFSTVTSDPSLEEEDLIEDANEVPIEFSNNPSKSSDGGGGLPGGAIAGIVIALLLLIVGITGLLFFQHKRRRNKVRDTEADSIHSQVYFDKDGDVGPVPTLGVEGGRPTYEYNLR